MTRIHGESSAFGGVTIDVAHGETFALLGPNSARTNGPYGRVMIQASR
jgi:ABC-type branched-subunit amino acid transport system ATPase component